MTPSQNQHRSQLSVLLCAYNEERFLPAALSSLQSQTRPPDAVIVVDDGSTDGTAALARSHPAVTKVISQKNLGLSAARNRGIREVRTPYFLFLDADDALEPSWCEVAASTLARSPNIDLLVGTAIYTDEDACRLTLRPSFRATVTARDLTDDNAFGPPSGPVINVELCRAVGGFREDMRFAEDWEFWRRLVPRANQLRLDVPMIRIRQRAGSMIRSSLGGCFDVEPALLEGLTPNEQERMRAYMAVNVGLRRLARDETLGVVEALQRSRAICPELTRWTLALESLARLPAPVRRTAMRARRGLRRKLGGLLDDLDIDAYWPTRTPPAVHTHETD